MSNDRLSKALGVRFCATCDAQIPVLDTKCYAYNCDNIAIGIVHWTRWEGHVEPTEWTPYCLVHYEVLESKPEIHKAGEMRNE